MLETNFLLYIGENSDCGKRGEGQLILAMLANFVATEGRTTAGVILAPQEVGS